MSLKNPGIVNRGFVRNRNQYKIYLSDMIYYSIGCFTFMSRDNWYPRDNFKIWVAFEGAIGWFLLGIFMATLIKTFVRI